jgi:hypothetical protein
MRRGRADLKFDGYEKMGKILSFVVCGQPGFFCDNNRFSREIPLFLAVEIACFIDLM